MGLAWTELAAGIGYKADQWHLEQPCEAGVSIGHMLGRAPGGMRKAADD